MAKDLIMDITQWQIYTRHSRSLFLDYVPDEPGCYAFFTHNLFDREEELLYIGTSQNLRTRIISHEIIRIGGYFLESPVHILIKAKVIADKELRIRTEKRLIKMFNPPLNTKINYAG